MCIHVSLGPFIRVANYVSHEHTRINGQFVHCRTLVATNVRTGVSSAKISLDLTEIDHLYECARTSWTRRDLIKTRLFLFCITGPYLLIF